ncbi:hypothetical protein QQ045_007081 [Rhodiola kirilowii]
MLSLTIESGKQLVELWEHKVEKGGGCAEIKIDSDIRSFTSCIISKAMFGSKNYAVGKKLFPQCKALMKALESPTLLDGLPFLRYHIYGHNFESWRTVTCQCSLLLFFFIFFAYIFQLRKIKRYENWRNRFVPWF